LPPKVEGLCDKCGAALITREDDNPKSIAVRFKTYQAQTAPLLDYYRSRGLLFAVDASAGAERATEQILKMLEKDGKAALTKG
jgi:adenylate kinase